MKRRDFVTSVIVAGLATPVIGDQQKGKEKKEEEDHGGHGHGVGDERTNNAVVSFGHWRPTPDYPANPAELNTANPQPIDRFAPNDPNPRRLNGHALTPRTTRVHVGDTVSFVISGFHNLLIYGPGTQPEDIDRTNLVPGSAPPLINDPKDRLYRGLDPRALPGFPPAPPPAPQNQDRVEVVGFNTAGKYLAMCGVLPHFFEPASAANNTPDRFVMYGFVDVRERD
jgi:plastocyanin